MSLDFLRLLLIEFGEFLAGSTMDSQKLVKLSLQRLWKKCFTRVATSVSYAAGHAVTFILCCAIVLLRAASGPFFGFSDTFGGWSSTRELQNTQNRDRAAIQAKLDELVRVSEGSNRFIGIENLSQEEIDEFRAKCEAAARKAKSSERRVKAEARRAVG
jgi:low affinity Fe/Cu permease